MRLQDQYAAQLVVAGGEGCGGRCLHFFKKHAEGENSHWRHQVFCRILACGHSAVTVRARGLVWNTHMHSHAGTHSHKHSHMHRCTDWAYTFARYHVS